MVHYTRAQGLTNYATEARAVAAQYGFQDGVNGVTAAATAPLSIEPTLSWIPWAGCAANAMDTCCG